MHLFLAIVSAVLLASAEPSPPSPVEPPPQDIHQSNSVLTTHTDNSLPNTNNFASYDVSTGDDGEDWVAARPKRASSRRAPARCDVDGGIDWCYAQGGKHASRAFNDPCVECCERYPETICCTRPLSKCLNS